MKRDFKYVDLCADLSNKSNHNIQHIAIQVPYYQRLSALADVLTCYAGGGKTIVFTSTKNDANSFLTNNNHSFNVEVMHGDIS